MYVMSKTCANVHGSIGIAFVWWILTTMGLKEICILLIIYIALVMQLLMGIHAEFSLESARNTMRQKHAEFQVYRLFVSWQRCHRYTCVHIWTLYWRPLLTGCKKYCSPFISRQFYWWKINAGNQNELNKFTLICEVKWKNGSKGGFCSWIRL